MNTAAAETALETPPPAEPATLRGTERGLEIVLDATAKLDDMATALEAALGKSPGFFAGSDVVVRSDAALPLGALSLLEEIAVRFALRIVEIGPSEPPRRRRTTRSPEPISEEELSIDITEELASDDADTAKVQALPAEAPAVEPGPPPPAPPLPSPDGGTRMVVGPVRSGVVLHAPGHLVVLGDVNPGAELRAGRSVIVLGALRGIAHAGCDGTNSFIFAMRLAPQQLRLGELIARPGDAEGDVQTPEIAHAAGGQIIVEDYRGKLPNGLTAQDL